MDSIDIKYSKPSKQISLKGVFNFCVVVPMRFAWGLLTMASPAGVILNNSFMGDLPLDRLERDLTQSRSKTPFKMEKTGLLGRGLKIVAEKRHPYGLRKTVRHCDIKFGSRAERNHYMQQIQSASKVDGVFGMGYYTDIAKGVLNGSLELNFNPQVKPFIQNSESSKQSLLSSVFGTSAEREHKKWMRQHRREMRRLGIR